MCLSFFSEIFDENCMLNVSLYMYTRKNVYRTRTVRMPCFRAAVGEAGVVGYPL
jgi:hypothetical protein